MRVYLDTASGSRSLSRCLISGVLRQSSQILVGQGLGTGILSLNLVLEVWRWRFLVYRRRDEETALVADRYLTGFAAAREVEDVGGVYVLARCRCEAWMGR